MPEPTISDRKLCIRIELLSNGVTVSAHVPQKPSKTNEPVDWEANELTYVYKTIEEIDRKSTRLNSSHIQKSRMPSSA